MGSNGENISYGVSPDVTFAFKNCEKVLQAEKRRLAQNSEVFRNQFFGDFDDKGRINVEDITYEVFNCLLKFIYLKRIEISADNYQDILYVARKYFIYSLIKKVIEFVETFITAENLVVTFEILEKFEIQSVLDHMRNIWIKDPVYIISELDGNKKIHMNLLQLILESPILDCSEYDLYVAVANMMEKASTNAIDISGEMRKKLGNKMLRLIRFPVMTLEQVALCGQHPSLLTPKEILDFQLWITQKCYSETMQFFSTKPRKDLLLVVKCSNCKILDGICSLCKKCNHNPIISPMYPMHFFGTRFGGITVPESLNSSR